MATDERTQCFRDALDLMEEHPAIASVSLGAEQEGYLSVLTDWYVSLPNRFLDAGLTDAGVCALEPVEWKFPLDYPLSAPEPTLRADFPTSLPHINPHKKGDRVSPCISDVSLLDLMHSAGFEAILDRMESWLNDAASGELIDPIQGWEPIRRDESFGFISADTLQIKTELEESNKPVRFYRYSYLPLDDLVLGNIETPSLGSQNSSYKAGSTGVNTATRYHQGPVVLFQSVPGKVYDNYWPESVTTYADIKCLAKKLDLETALEARVKFILSKTGKEALHKKGRREIREFLVIFAVLRPCHVIGTDSPWELLAYRIPYGDSSERVSKNTTVYAPNLTLTCCQEILRSVSGEAQGTMKDIEVIGCGSLGSKLTLHLSKIGSYNFRLFDDDFFSSHNNARHGLVVDYENRVVASKCNLLEEELSKLGVQAESIRQDIISLASNGKRIFKKNANFIIDTTASLPVRYCLSHLSDMPGQLIHSLMYGKCKMGVVSIEDSRRSARIDDQTAFLNSLCIDDEQIRKCMYGERVSRHVFSDGCSSATSVMSDMDLSLMSAAIASKIHNHIGGVVTDTFTGALMVALVDNDFNLSWEAYPFRPTVVIDRDESYSWQIRILGNISDDIERESQQDSSVEQGGILVGSYCALSKTIYITKLVAAPKASRNSSDHMDIATNGLEESFDLIHRATNGQSTFVGTWHSHTSPTPPSQIDKDTYKKLSMNYDLPIVMLMYTGGRIVRV